jgi:hypothetical protein
VTISHVVDEDGMDLEFMEFCGVDGDGSISLSEVRSALLKIQGSMHRS